MKNNPIIESDHKNKFYSILEKNISATRSKEFCSNKDGTYSVIYFEDKKFKGLLTFIFFGDAYKFYHNNIFNWNDAKSEYLIFKKGKN